MSSYADRAAEVLALHGWEFGDGLDVIYCDCGWTMDAYIEYEAGLPERAASVDGDREIAALIRHRYHVATALAEADE